MRTVTKNTKHKYLSIASQLRNSTWSRLLLFVLTVNFINLSANFYEGNILQSEAVELSDPVDTISELVLEWALDCPDDTIPDNGTQQDDNSTEKLKLAITELPGFSLDPGTFPSTEPAIPPSEEAVPGYLSSSAPPPDYC